MPKTKAKVEKSAYRTVKVKITARASALEAFTKSFGGINIFFQNIIKEAEKENIETA